MSEFPADAAQADLRNQQPAKGAPLPLSDTPDSDLAKDQPAFRQMYARMAANGEEQVRLESGFLTDDQLAAQMAICASLEQKAEFLADMYWRQFQNVAHSKNAKRSNMKRQVLMFASCLKVLPETLFSRVGELLEHRVAGVEAAPVGRPPSFETSLVQTHLPAIQSAARELSEDDCVSDEHRRVLQSVAALEPGRLSPPQDWRGIHRPAHLSEGVDLIFTMLTELEPNTAHAKIKRAIRDFRARG